jgi:dihydrofolate reductase
MPRLIVFNSVSLDGYFVDRHGDIRWAHNASPDAEWDAFVAGNARGGGMLLFGRKTYELMASYWPTPLAAQNDPAVAAGMNALPKVVFSRTLDRVSWAHTRLVKDDPVGEIRRLKAAPGPDMAILGSGTLVAQLTPERLIDAYQMVVVPVVLGQGRTLFDGLAEPLRLTLTSARTFRNGNVVLSYAPQERD